MVEEVIGHVFGESTVGEFDGVWVVDEVNWSGYDGCCGDDIGCGMFDKDCFIC